MVIIITSETQQKILKENSMQTSDILEIQFVQRAYDGKWEKVVKVMDHENAYTYKEESGVLTTLTPEKWLTVAVYDAMMVFE
jgi:hypothetical protein